MTAQHRHRVVRGALANQGHRAESVVEPAMNRTQFGGALGPCQDSSEFLVRNLLPEMYVTRFPA